MDVELVDGLTRSRWGTKSSVWDVRWGLLPGPAGAESGADQGAFADGCRAGRRSGLLIVLSGTDLPYLNLFPTGVQLLPLFLLEGQVITFPLDAPGSDGSSSGAETRQTHRSAHVVLQIWDMCRAHIPLRR